MISKLKFFIKNKLQKIYLKKFFDNIKDPQKKIDKKICIYSALPNSYLSFFEILLYRYLIYRGFTVDYYIYDKHCIINELINSKNYFDKKRLLGENYILGKENLKASGIKFKTIQNIKDRIFDDIEKLSSLEDVFNFSVDNIKIGLVVRRTIFRFYKKISIEKEPHSLKICKEYLIVAVQNYLFVRDNLFHKKYDLFLFSHGIYSSWEPLSLFCSENNIDYIAYDRGKRKDTMTFNLNSVAPGQSFNASWKYYIERELSSSETDLASQYLNERKKQNNDLFKFNRSRPIESKNIIKKKLKLDNEDIIIVFYANLLWDAASVWIENEFSDLREVILKVSSYLLSNKKVKILVRPHPAENISGQGTNERFKDLFNNVPSNVCFIDENLNLNSFDILSITDIGISHTSTIGLELAMMGKPSIVLSSETHYCKKGFTIEPSNFSNLIKKIEFLISNKIYLNINETQARLSLKYFYMMMFLYIKKVPLSYEDRIFKNYKYRNFDQLKDHSSFLDSINKYIMNEDDLFILDWSKR